MLKLLRRIGAPRLLGGALALNGFVNLATGLVPLFRAAGSAAAAQQPFAASPVQRTSGLLSVFLGVALIMLGKGLCEHRRRSWWLSISLLSILMANNLYRGTTPQTAVLSGGLIVGLLVFRGQFSARSGMKMGYAQTVALASVVFAVCYGVVGSYTLRAQFDGIDSWTDALYFTFVTYSTLGYGDILPVTQDAKLFATSMVPVGLVSFVTALSALLAPAIERRVKGVFTIMERLHRPGDHVVVCGYSNVTESIIDELQARDVSYVIVDDREDLVLQLRNRGHDVLAGDPARRETLEQANLRTASAIISGADSDSVNVLVALTAREIRDSAKGARFRILVRVEDEENIAKARRAGADEVISPSTAAGRALATRAVEGRPAATH